MIKLSYIKYCIVSTWLAYFLRTRKEVCEYITPASKTCLPDVYTASSIRVQRVFETRNGKNLCTGNPYNYHQNITSPMFSAPVCLHWAMGVGISVIEKPHQVRWISTNRWLGNVQYHPFCNIPYCAPSQQLLHILWKWIWPLLCNIYCWSDYDKKAHFNIQKLIILHKYTVLTYFQWIFKNVGHQFKWPCLCHRLESVIRWL